MFNGIFSPTDIRSLALIFVKDPTKKNFETWKKVFTEKVDTELKYEEMGKVSNNLENFSKFVCVATKSNTVNDCVKINQKENWIDKEFMLVFNDGSHSHISHTSPLVCQYLGLAPNGHKFSKIKNEGFGITLFLSDDFVPFDTKFISAVAHEVTSQGYGWFCNLPTLEEQHAYLPVDEKEGAFWHVDDENQESGCTLFRKGIFNKEKSVRPTYAAKHQKNSHPAHYTCGIDIESYPYDLSLQTEFVLLNKMFKFMLKE